MAVITITITKDGAKVASEMVTPMELVAATSCMLTVLVVELSRANVTAPASLLETERGLARFSKMLHTHSSSSPVAPAH